MASCGQTARALQVTSADAGVDLDTLGEREEGVVGKVANRSSAAQKKKKKKNKAQKKKAKGAGAAAATTIAPTSTSSRPQLPQPPQPPQSLKSSQRPEIKLQENIIKDRPQEQEERKYEEGEHPEYAVYDRLRLELPPSTRVGGDVHSGDLQGKECPKKTEAGNASYRAPRRKAVTHLETANFAPFECSWTTSRSILDHSSPMGDNSLSTMAIGKFEGPLRGGPLMLALKLCDIDIE